MTPAAIVQRIIDLGMNENAPDTELQTKALGWLNATYQEAYGLASSYAWPYYLQSQTIAITNGAGTLTTAPKRIIEVKDTVSNRILKTSDYMTLSMQNPAMNTSGNPAKYYMTGATTINTYPINSTTIKVSYVPYVTDLTLTSAEADIKIPPEYHMMLVWGGMLEGMLYERGFGNDGLIQVANLKYTELKDNYSRWLKETYPRDVQRVKYQDF